MIMKKKFELPEKWCIKVTSENADTLTKWRKETSSYVMHVCNFDYITYIGAGTSKDITEYYKYQEITYEQFKKYVLKEKTTMKLIGYKLKRKDYYEAASQIMYGNPYGSDFLKNIIPLHTYCLENLKKAEVLDTWFEPVYEEEKFKVGDWVVVLPEDSFYDNAEQGVAQEIITLKQDPNHFWYSLRFSNGGRNSYTKVRKATYKEIEEAKKLRSKVVIKGYDAEYLKGCVKFGCKTIPNDFIVLLHKLQNIHDIDFTAEKDNIAKLVQNLKY